MPRTSMVHAVTTIGMDMGKSADRQPCAAVACEQPVGSGRTGAAGGVIGKIRGRILRPGIYQALNRSPSAAPASREFLPAD